MDVKKILPVLVGVLLVLSVFMLILANGPFWLALRSQRQALESEESKKKQVSHKAWLDIHDARKIPAPQKELEVSNGIILVSIPCYRDPDLVNTLASMYAQAKNPGRVFTFVCEQLEAERVQSPSSPNETVFAVRDRSWILRMLELQQKEGEEYDSFRFLRAAVEGGRLFCADFFANAATGPIKARRRIEVAMEGFLEESRKQGKITNLGPFVLMIDSHTRFRKGWDTICVQELHACEEVSTYGQAVLTAYPSGFKRNEDKPHINVTLDDAKFDTLAKTTFLFSKRWSPHSGFIEYRSMPLKTLRDARKEKKPEPPVKDLLKSIGWSACFSFHRSYVLDVCSYWRDFSTEPFDFVFIGEEFGFGKRLYERGFDLFQPRVPIICTAWDRTYRPIFWDDAPRRLAKQIQQRSAEKSEEDALGEAVSVIQRTKLHSYERFRDVVFTVDVPWVPRTLDVDSGVFHADFLLAKEKASKWRSRFESVSSDSKFLGPFKAGWLTTDSLHGLIKGEGEIARRHKKR